MYQRLVQYKEKHGDCLVPRKYEADPRLGAWVETQRALWNRDFRGGGRANSPAVGALTATEPSTQTSDARVGEGDGYKASEEWGDEFDKKVEGDNDDGSRLEEGATEEDAAELAEAIGTDEGIAMSNEEQQATAVAEALAFAVDVSAVKRLTLERKEKLDALGFVWSLRSKRIDDHWDEMFRHLLEYKEKHGDTLVPSRYEDNPKLGKWVETQRYEFTKLQRATVDVSTENKVEDADIPVAAAAPLVGGKPKAPNVRLTEERLQRLNSIAFEWKVKHKMKRYYDRQWDQMFDRLLQYKETFGNCLVPKRYPTDQKLGTWVHTQRIQYRKMVAGKNGSTYDSVQSDTGSVDDTMPPMNPGEEVQYRLTEERRKRLEDIGFCWSAREAEKGAEQGKIARNSYDDQWDAMFNRLRDFKEKHGHCLVPKRCQEDPKLGTWVDTQRVQYKKMKKKLADQGVGQVGSADTASQSGNSDTDVAATSSVSEKPIIGRLTDGRIHRLEELGFVWSLRDDWQRHYEELTRYREEHGHCNVPARYEKNRKLGIWVSAQRQQYKLMKSQPDSKARRSAPLTQERINLLNDLGFSWSIRSRDTLGESWNQKFMDLVRFRDAYGHCNVPSRFPENPELGVWVGTQRTQYRFYVKAKEAGEPIISAMNEDRIRQLEQLGFVWNIRGETRRDNDCSGMEALAMAEEAIQAAAAEFAPVENGAFPQVIHNSDCTMTDDVADTANV